MPRIATLCIDCADNLKIFHKVKQIGKTTTEKKQHCENCNTAKDLKQYLIKEKR